jgi:hypothetical protein
MEGCQFHSFSGARNEIILKVWGLLGEGTLCPKNSKPKHLLWALYFFESVCEGGPQMLRCWWV